MLRNTGSHGKPRIDSSLPSALGILFWSRKKNALIYMLATIVGLFCVPGGLPMLISNGNLAIIMQKVVPLPAISLLVTAGIYVINDLADVKNDRANNKNRPISSGVVSRRDAIVFVIVVNVAACLVAVVTQSLATLFILGPLIALGPLYSAPRIGLKDRFVLKTLSISTGMMLCLMLGASAGYQNGRSAQSWSMAAYGAAMVGMMIFVTSPYNDLGDARGDRESGRRTIPIVLGYTNTLYLISAFATAMFACALSMYFLGFISWLAPACQGAVTVFMILTAFNTINRNGDEAFIRKRHSGMVPLHLLVHAGIILGILFA